MLLQLVIVIITTTEDVWDEDYAHIIVEDITEPIITLEKTVWNETSLQWEESITAEIGDIVRFNITITYYGDYFLYHINITDTLPCCLVYANNADPVESGIIGNIVFWNQSDLILMDGDSYSIEFDAEVVSTGINVNRANLICNECGEDIYEFEKKVWNISSQQWEESITAEVGDIVRFNITFTYYGDYVLYNISVTDTLPNCLIYADNADPVESDVEGNIVFWNLTDLILTDGESYSIEFDAEVVSTGINVNRANLDADECNGDIWEIEDTATVYVEGPKLFEKKVWNISSQQWEESITAEVGDIVRFNLSISYYGPNILYDIRIRDILPVCLEYANNADPIETEISGNEILWFISDVLETGDSFYIEFDAEVIDNGTNINKANLTAQECSVNKI